MDSSDAAQAASAATERFKRGFDAIIEHPLSKSKCQTRSAVMLVRHYYCHVKV
jgi:hypothetical protein